MTRPGYKSSWLPVVLGTSRHEYELSWVRVVLGTSCLGYELSWVWVVLGTNFLRYELSWVRVVNNPFRDVEAMASQKTICLTHNFRRLNALHTVSWPAHSPSCTPSSIGNGPNWLRDMVTLPSPSRNHSSSIMTGNPGGLGWHPISQNYSSEPINAMQMPSSS